MLISTDGGVAFAGVNNCDSRGQWNLKSTDTEKYAGMGEVARDKQFYKLGIEYLRTLTPIQMLKLEILKIGAFLYPFLPAYDITYGLIFPFWIYGMFLMYKQSNANNYLLFFTIVMFFASVITICGVPRHRGPMAPYMIVFGVAGLENILLRFNYRVKTAAALSAWVALNLLIFYYYEPLRMAVKNIRNI